MEDTPCPSDPRPNVARRNFWVNAVTALVFCAILGTSVLLEWVLPAGHGHDIEWLGYTRHFWGEVHFWLGVGLLALTVTHVVLHAQWVASCWRRSIGTLRSPLSWLLLGVGVTLILLPVLVPHQHLGVAAPRTALLCESDESVNCAHGERTKEAGRDGGWRNGRN
jgi:hypothetical protein